MGIHDTVVLGLDPGRDKIGFAAVRRDKSLLFSGILPSQESAVWERALGCKENVKEILSPWLRECPASDTERLKLSLIVVGNGTCSDSLLDNVRCCARCEVLCVDEHGTTLEARRLYWRLHRPTWWQRLLPQDMRVPPRPLDDLAAWAIANRGIERTEG
ncbi:MAG: endonuclease [Fretibacterium sp.]|nr:endonuclease [Fretibacterium sp.]